MYGDWLEYSIKHDAAFCFPCHMFGNYESVFCNPGFTSWNKAAERFKVHVGGVTSAHNNCVTAWKSYKLAQSTGIATLDLILLIVTNVNLFCIQVQFINSLVPHNVLLSKKIESI